MQHDRHHEDELEATEEQIEALRGYGVQEHIISELSYESAEEMLIELQAIRDDAGHRGTR